LPELLQSVADLGLLRADGDRDQIFARQRTSDCAPVVQQFAIASTRFVHTLWWAKQIVTEALTLQAGSPGVLPTACVTVINRL